jgi:hypothetical protein
MYMTWEHDGQLVTELARSGVSRAAPDELPQFDVTAQAFLAAPARARRGSRRDDPLGLGLDSVDVLLSTAALTVTLEVLKHLAEHYSDKLVSKLGQRICATLRRRGTRRSGEPALPLPQLDPQQLSELHALAHRKALALQIPDDKAALVADGIIAELATRAGLPAVNE